MTTRVSIALSFLLLSACSDTPPDNHAGMHHTTAASSTFLPGEEMDVSQLPVAKKTETLDVRAGETITLVPTIVRKNLNGRDYVMYGYNGQIPGPLIRAEQGTEFKVLLRNDIDLPTTVHWHGIRLENAFDGVPGITQKTIMPNGTFEYAVRVPDEGLYWYHPHMREDIQQNLGLFGNILVEPKGGIPFGPSQQQEFLVLGDLLVGADGTPVPYGKESPTHTLMGRYGNMILVNGDTSYKGVVLSDTVVRYFITNVASARPFLLSFEGARMKLVGSEGGRYAKESFVDSLTISPSERYIVDVYFEKPGIVRLLNEEGKKRELGMIRVFEKQGTPSFKRSFESLLEHPDILRNIDLSPYLAAEPQKSLRVELQMSGNMAGMDHATADLKDGVEWEDSMPGMNSMSNLENVHWRLVDEETGKANMDINWEIPLGSIMKIRVRNDDESMQHPIHFHGQRFLILQQGGKEPPERAWKDSVLLRNGETVDLLVEFANPGTWMFHCHIAEHMEDGMMGLFTVR